MDEMCTRHLSDFRSFPKLRKSTRHVLIIVVAACAWLFGSHAQAADPWVVYDGKFDGPGRGKHIVLISGDEEYRSEEALPQLGKILAIHHGFKCTVLFAIDKKDGTINPNQTDNIPGLEALKSADLMIIFTRFRNLPDEQMKHIVDYVKSDRPIIGLRTATHAFDLKTSTTYAHYSWNSKDKDWEGGFGRQVLGETWVNHHGAHGKESTRGIIAKGEEGNPILRGIKDGDIWGPTDVYTVKLPLPALCEPLVMGQVLEGMKPDGKPVTGAKNDPLMPVAWSRFYKGKDAQAGIRTFTTTMGACAGFAKRRATPAAGQRLLLGSRHGGQDSGEGEGGHRRRVQTTAVRE